jgi:hypothetical protein
MKLYTSGGIDSDGDGVPDAYETNTGTYVSPTDTGSDPNDPDTDGDGYSDGEEVNWQPTYTDPNDAGDKPQYSAGTYYAAADNPLWGDGTQGNPWNLHTAIHHINGGSGGGTYTLHVAVGTYSIANEPDEALEITQDDVEVIGESGSSPVLDGTSATIWLLGIQTSGDSITIENLEIRNFSIEGIYISGSDTTISDCNVHHNVTSGAVTAGIQLAATPYNTDVTIKNCDVHDNGSGVTGNGIGIIHGDIINIKDCDVSSNANIGINVDAPIAHPTTNVNIEENLIEDNPCGIEILYCSPNVKRNEIEDNGTGIYIDGGTTGASPIIWNNIIYPLDSTIQNGIEVYGIASPSIYHNTIDGGSGSIDGIYVDTSSGTTYIEYNIITNFGQYGINNNSGTPTIDYNDIWNNGTNYNGCSAGTNDISEDPKYASYELQGASPCIDTIPASGPPNDPVDIDFAGNSRPRDSGYDMGAYEYIADYTYNTSLPGGSGNVTDYRIYTIPVNLGTGSDLKAAMQSQLGAYNKSEWRVFGRSGASYLEMDSPGFLSLPFNPGNAFWITSFGTDALSFSGQPAPDGTYHEIPLNPGWNLFGLPWHSNSIDLGKIAVSADWGTTNYWITSVNNTLTQKCIWDYTGGGPHSGYEKRELASYDLVIGTGYWINNITNPPVAITMLVPPDNSGGYFTATSFRGGKILKTSSNGEEEPPPPPGGTSNSSGFKIEAESGCFIATAAYGSGLHPYVNILRDFRDAYLLSNVAGKTFVALYYRYSPPVAELIADNAPLKYLTRLFLLPLIGFSAFMLYANPIFWLIGFVGFVLVTGYLILVTRNDPSIRNPASRIS